MKRRPLLVVITIVLFTVLGLWGYGFVYQKRKDDTWTMLAFLVQIGAEKKDVERQFGKALRGEMGEKGDVCTYPYSISFFDRWHIFVTYGSDGRAVFGQTEGKEFRPDDPPVEF